MSKPYKKKSGSVSKKPKQSSKPRPKPTEPRAPTDDAENCECCQAIHHFTRLCPEHVRQEVAEEIPGLVAELRQLLHTRKVPVPLMDAALFVAWRMTRSIDAEVAMDHWVETLNELAYFQEDEPSDDQAAPGKEESA